MVDSMDAAETALLVRKTPMMQEATVARAICAVYTFELPTR
jgi:hypothetical protein